MLRLNVNLTYGSAFAVASDVPALLEGVHADSVVFFYDEAKSIRPDTFDATEGAFAGQGETFALVIGTPANPRAASTTSVPRSPVSRTGTASTSAWSEP